MRKDFDAMAIINGKIYTKKQFMSLAETHHENETIQAKMFGSLNYFFYTRNHIFPNSTYANKFSDLKFNFRNSDKSSLLLWIHKLRIRNINLFYDQYVSIVDKFRISNPGSQHTSSFHPQVFNSLEDHRVFKENIFGSNYINRDLASPGNLFFFIFFLFFIFSYFLFFIFLFFYFNFYFQFLLFYFLHLDLLYFLIFAKLSKIPRPIIHMISSYLVSFKLYDIIDKELKEKNEKENKKRKKKIKKIKKFDF